MNNEEVVSLLHDEFELRGLSPQTEESYLCALRLFLRYHEDRPLENMGEPETRDFLLYQISIGKTNGSVNIYNSALRFIFGAVLGRNLNCRDIVRFFSVIDNLRDKAMFETVYGAGLRLSEIVHLRVQRICWSPAWMFARSKSCWVIPLSKPRPFIFT